MKIMMFFFDYIYYRVKKKLYKKDSEGIFASCMVAAIQILTLADILLLISKLFLTRVDTAPYAKLIALFGGVLFVIAVAINFRKYHKSYWAFWEHWKNEPEDDRSRKGWLVFLSIASPFLILILIGVLL